MFKSITPEQHSAFVAALGAGQYNLLLGAGSSMDSRNSFGTLPSGEGLKDELCAVTGAEKKHSLQRVFELLTPEQVSKHVTQRLSECVPGDTPKLMKKFLWKRMFTWNIDDVIENTYDIQPNRQRLTPPVHYNDDFTEAQSLTEVMLIHLHGTVQMPEKGYVFSRDNYIQQLRTINTWMSVLSTFIHSEPFIIAGTTLDEIDLDYYLSFRTDVTAREDRGPSIFVTADDDAVTAALCKKHNLLHFVGWTSHFMRYCSATLPNPPTPEELIPQEERKLLPAGISKAVVRAFHSDFELVPASAKASDTSRFQYGHTPTWSDLSANLDISRPIVSRLLVMIEAMLKDDTSPAQLLLLTDNAGTGKTTIVRRVAFELAKKGIRTLLCSALSRIDRTAASALDMIDGPVVVVVDNLADQAPAVAEMLGQLERKDAVILASERAYRSRYLESILPEAALNVIDRIALTQIEVERLIDKYFEYGFVGDHRIRTRKAHYTRILVNDPIAIACCRIQNNFKPLERIVDDLVRDASEREINRYLCASLAQHCFTGGVSYNILVGAVDPRGITQQLGRSSPLPLTYFDADRNYVIPENSTLAERVLVRTANEDKVRLLNVFVSLANEIRPFVNRQTIKNRTPEARLAGRLFDYDDIAGRLLEAYPAVPGGPRCGMRAWLSCCSRRPRRGAQWPRADRFRSFKRRFPTRRAAPPFCWSGVGRRVLFVPAVASNAPRR